MIELAQFKNFRLLRESTLPLNRCTLLIGPNGSGKSTALQGIQAVGNPGEYDCEALRSVSASSQSETSVTLKLTKSFGGKEVTSAWLYSGKTQGPTFTGTTQINPPNKWGIGQIKDLLTRVSIYSLEVNAILSPVKPRKALSLDEDGSGLAGVLTQIQDKSPERFEALNEELNRWLPEFDRILLDFNEEGKRVFSLRTAKEHHRYSALDISHGNLFALTILTLAYLPDLPPVICFEEPDAGIHPRLLQDVQEALYRLAYPENYGETRDPVQVIATTHSPYMLDLFRDHPEEIVIAERVDDNVEFQRLSDRPDIDEILGDTPLGEAWYSGILGGVPARA